MPTNQEVANKLREIYNLMQLAGENRFRALAFDRAAQTIEGLSDQIDPMIKNRSLTDLKGIGKSIAEDIYSYAETGSIPVLDSLKEKIPAGLMKWLDISGLGPKNILKVYEELGISEISELKVACEDGRIAALPGLGEKSAIKIRKSIEWLEQFDERCRLDEALAIAETMMGYLKKQKGVQKIEAAGSLRRHNETIGDIDILIAADSEHIESIFDAFTTHDFVVDILGRGDTKSSIRTGDGRQVDLRIVSAEEFPAALLYFTGSKEHNVVLRQRARQQGMSLNEYGLYHQNSEGERDVDRPLKFQSEEDIYKLLGVHYIPPIFREDRGEFDYFELQTELSVVNLSDIRGVIHAHSTWSDGKFSIDKMARACIERGYEYLGISDHSKTAAYAGGLSIDEVKHQWDEIDTLNERFIEEQTDFRIFKGIESDILSDGSLDYPDDILEGFDFVIASVHFALDLPLDQMMSRFKRAIEHPATRIVGHPTGRLLLKRNESLLDMNQLIDWAVEHNTAIEINANPWRLDLDWRHGNKALETGLLTSVNPDAHTIDGIDDIQYGVMIAQKGKFEKKRVLNALSAADFGRWLKSG